MRRSFLTSTDVESTRDHFLIEFAKRGPTSVGRELGVSGDVDARRRFVLAIQGWERNHWVRPFLTRLEGHFERSQHNDYTRVVFETRGLTLPLTFLSLLIPYSVLSAILPGWEGIDPPLLDIALVIISVVLVPVIGSVFFFIERRTHRLLIDALLAGYGRPSLED
ncbi:MAG: hypothetical protein GYB66_13455 [Chloroflexi bacterium]|nr:hypothetical protein [Chloroflexota bacterium]